MTRSCGRITSPSSFLCYCQSENPYKAHHVNSAPMPVIAKAIATFSFNVILFSPPMFLLMVQRKRGYWLCL